MSLLRRLEQRLEELIEGVFARTFRGRVHPTEIADRIVREIEKQRTVSISAVYVPNEFTIRVHPEDLAYLQPLGAALTRELEQYVRQYAEEHGYAMVGRSRVLLEEYPGGHPGGLGIGSEMLEIPPEGRLTGLSGPVAGLEFPLEGDCIRLGRAPDNEITIDDHNLSRTHAQLVRQKQGFMLVDLGSTNGTYVNSQKVSQTVLREGDEIAVGLSRLRFGER